MELKAPHPPNLFTIQPPMNDTLDTIQCLARIYGFDEPEARTKLQIAQTYGFEVLEHLYTPDPPSEEDPEKTRKDSEKALQKDMKAAEKTRKDSEKALQKDMKAAAKARADRDKAAEKAAEKAKKAAGKARKDRQRAAEEGQEGS